MKSIKKIIFLLIVPFMTSHVMASSDSNIVYLHLNTGETLAFALSDKPRFVTEDDVVTFSSGNFEVEYLMEEIDKVSFTPGAKKDHSSVDIPIGSNGTAIGNKPNGIVTLKDFKKGAVVQVFKANGELVDRFKITSENSVDLNISAYPKGIYILKSETMTCKITKK